MRTRLTKFALATLIAGGALFSGPLLAQTANAAYSVEVAVTAGPNQLGVKQGERIFLDFMLDPGLTRTASLSTQQVNVFIDPWRWHWRLWDWLRTFIIRIPIPGPDPGPLQIEAVFDDASDMIMPMPGSVELTRGASFRTSLRYRPDSAFLREQRIPMLAEINAGLVSGNFEVFNAQGERVFTGEVAAVKGTAPAPACAGDLDGDGDVDSSDVRIFRRDFGRKNCPIM